MRMSKERFPLPTLSGMQDEIDPTPDYQRPPVWTLKQKQLLIDSILRGYDIPKVYWQRLPENSNGVEFAVIDGQQRLRTVWEFFNGEFALAKNADKVDGTDVNGKHKNELSPNLRRKLDIYSFDVVIVEDAVQNDDEDEVRDMFLRLQNGTTLKAQEKRNAMTGQMRNFVKKLATHSFFEQCHFSNKRFTYDHVAAQLIRLEEQNGPTNVRDRELNILYEEHAGFDAKGPLAKKVNRVLNFLNRGFPEKTGELEHYNVIALYCVASALIDKFVITGAELRFRNWFIEFEKKRKEDEKQDEDDRDPQLVEYRRLTSQSTDAEESISSRVRLLQSKFFLECSDLELLDENRNFIHEQRLAIFRRDGGKCQLAVKCNGEKLPWDDWHADHIKPHAEGGKTTVDNGQVSCQACNLAKGKKQVNNG